jgi:hypothetical protein
MALCASQVGDDDVLHEVPGGDRHLGIEPRPGIAAVAIDADRLSLAVRARFFDGVL